MGVLTITPEGKLSTELVPVSGFHARDAAVEGVISRLKDEYAAMGARKIGHSQTMLPAKDSDGDWLVRTQETSLGDLCADAIRIRLGAEIGMLGGGSIRKDLPAGDLRYDDIFNVFPFNNTGSTATLSGEAILDILEFGVAAYPTDFGGFLHVSGLTYQFDPSVESPVVYDINKAFVRIDPGERRVRDVRVLDPDTGKYLPLDPARMYSVGGTNYLLISEGDGYSMLKNAGHDTGIPDVDLLERYIVENLSGEIGAARYGKPDGRITVVK